MTAEEVHLMFVAARAEAVRKWMATDMDASRNVHGLQRALDAQAGDVDYLLGVLSKRDEALAQAWSEGADAGYKWALLEEPHMEPDVEAQRPINPYRKATS